MKRHCTNPGTLESRRRCMALLDELQTAGLLTYELSEHRAGERGPHLEVHGRRDRIGLPAPPGSVSEAAAQLWELLRTGRVHDLL